MILRIKRHQTNFVMIDAVALRNPRMSCRAKGLLAYLLTLPDNWVVMVSELEKHFSDGRFSLQKAFRELRDHGHATLEPVRDAAGKMAGREWHIHERAKKIRPIHVREPVEDEEEAA
jgi:hypothetical protein